MSGVLQSMIRGALALAADQAPVILGPVIFGAFEVPSRMRIGGAQAVVIHRMPGGSRIIDAMGTDDGSICWSGCFTGPMAAARARLVDGMRQSGALVGLSFADYAYSVVVVQFWYDLQDGGAVVSYRIRCEILPDDTGLLENSSVSFASSMANDIAAASAALSGQSFAPAQIALESAARASTLPGGPNSGTTIAAVFAALNAGGNAIQHEIASSGQALTSCELATPGELSTAVAAAAALAAGVQASGYLNRGESWLGQLAGWQSNTPLIYA